MRKRLFEIIEIAEENDKLSNVYDFFMMIVILLSLVPLTIKEQYAALDVIDLVCVVIFIIDYALRLFTADQKLHRGVWSFFIYPFTPMAIVDLLCILPSLHVINEGFRVLKILRLIRALRVFRIFKVIRFSKNIHLIKNVFIRQKKPLAMVGFMAIAYVFISALVVFNVEPESFDTFFDAFYWAAVSLTTVGYGDIYPVTAAGRVVTMLSSMFGIAIIALPSGIITAGFMEELQKNARYSGNRANKPRLDNDEGNVNLLNRSDDAERLPSPTTENDDTTKVVSPSPEVNTIDGE